MTEERTEGAGMPEATTHDHDATDEEVLAAARRSEPFPTLMAAIPRTPEGPRKPLTAKERRHAKHAFEHDLKANRAERRRAERAERKARRAERERYRSIGSQLRERDLKLTDKAAAHRRLRSRATGVYDAIGFCRMFADGICEVEPGLYSETLAFTDASYQSASEEAQKATFDAMAQLIDYFGADTMVQVSVTNEAVAAGELAAHALFDEAQTGDNAPLAREFNEILRAKIAEGSSHLTRTRTLTYATEATDPTHAAAKLSRMRAAAVAQHRKTVLDLPRSSQQLTIRIL